MIGQIGSLGKGSLRVGLSSSLLYTLGMSFGAAMTGLALGGFGLLIRWLFDLGYRQDTPGVWLPLSVFLLFIGLRDLGILKVSFPGPIKQLNRSWMASYGPYQTSFLWGVILGFSCKTRIHYGVHYATAIWCLFSGAPVWAAGVMAVYGVASGMLLSLETVSIHFGKDPFHGVLGANRTAWLYTLGGMVLIAGAVFLAAQSVRV